MHNEITNLQEAIQDMREDTRRKESEDAEEHRRKETDLQNELDKLEREYEEAKERHALDL